MEENAGRSQGEPSAEKPDGSWRVRLGRKAYLAASSPDEETTAWRSSVDHTEDRTPPAEAESIGKLVEKRPA
ncbi:hypothetical protein NDU88_003560 [Pleurodeles waltl]|uniref:Uncharacterized protein n=1 Tax=Pleurodeles waltl TaxID=8319 RepID=A0AAV7W2I9_PLEWA|nr:hypothetical protein NDU88_003560 [Pleurodeles waltl]